jgi:hypothetical protein
MPWIVIILSQPCSTVQMELAYNKRALMIYSLVITIFPSQKGGAEVGIKESGIIGIFQHSGKGPKRKRAETERGRKKRGRKERGVIVF